MRVASDGPAWIGLIDGYFGSCASVWHKEILYALSVGCHVWGAASMGALRAAECQPFGMVPIGAIAWGYASGQLVNDADVALTHGPRELDYVPFTEALVDVRATLGGMLSKGAVDPSTEGRLLDAAQALHFTERTVERIAERAGYAPAVATNFLELYETFRVRAKQADALKLVHAMAGFPPETTSSALVPARSKSMAMLLTEVGSPMSTHRKN